MLVEDGAGLRDTAQSQIDLDVMLARPCPAPQLWQRSSLLLGDRMRPDL